jgi:type IV pilus assembly protein PilC
MFNFEYKVVTKERTVRKGFVKALNPATAKKKVLQEEETAISFTRVSSPFFSKYLEKNIFVSFPKFERILFFRNLSTMMASGLSLVESLNTSAEVVKKESIKEIIKDMSSEVENGANLSKAMKKYSKLFPSYLIETVRLGELSGTLTDTLDQIAFDLEKDYELSRKVMQALLYPVIILLVMFVLLLVLVVFVLPKIAELYKDLEVDLPFLTKSLLGIGSSIANNPLIYGASFTLTVTFFILLYKIPKAKYVYHYILLQIPIIKHIIKEFNLVKFFRSLETLVTSGASWVLGVDIAQKTLSNDVYRKATKTVPPVLLNGKKLSKALEPYPELFPIQSIKILEIGERTGSLEETLQKVSCYHEKSLNHTVKMMTTMIEPVLMLFIGIIVGGIALSVFMPIYQLVNLI